MDTSSPKYGEKATYYSAVCLETGEVAAMAVAGNTNAATSVTFLQQLRKQQAEPLIVIWDNGPAHHGPELREYLTTPDLHLRLVPLPGYSPDFNPDEAIWDWIREDVTANICFGTAAKVREKVDAFFVGLAERTGEVQRRCRRDLQAQADALVETSHSVVRSEQACRSHLGISLGLQGMIDPPRAEAIRAVQACQAAGISVKMITGDHAKTASVIACQIGLKNSCVGPDGEVPTVLTGRELAMLSDEELMQAAEHTAVFARVSPEQKLRLVEALQARNHVVAMTGDGVNDAPALKQANIGVAMGVAGTEVSKEAADMVLTDDNFATIEAAVEEGRGVFDNLTKIIAWTLPTNLGEALIILAAIIAGVTLPILPAQILWINMITVVLLGLVLALEVREPDIMRRRPRAPDAAILTRALLIRVLLVGGLILVAAFGLFEWALREGRSIAQARTIAVNVVIFIELLYLFNCRSLTESMFKIGVFSNPWAFAGAGALVLIQLLFTYAPFMNSFLSSAPLALIDWGLILAAGVITYCIVEIEKWLRRRNTRRHDG